MSFIQLAIRMQICAVHSVQVRDAVIVIMFHWCLHELTSVRNCLHWWSNSFNCFCLRIHFLRTSLNYL